MDELSVVALQATGAGKGIGGLDEGLHIGSRRGQQLNIAGIRLAVRPDANGVQGVVQQMGALGSRGRDAPDGGDSGGQNHTPRNHTETVSETTRTPVIGVTMCRYAGG